MEHDPKQILWRALADSPVLMVGLKASGAHSMPMKAILDDEGHPETIWFFTTKDNRLTPGGGAIAQFVSRGHDLFACQRPCCERARRYQSDNSH